MVAEGIPDPKGQQEVLFRMRRVLPPHLTTESVVANIKEEINRSSRKSKHGYDVNIKNLKTPRKRSFLLYQK